MQEIISCFIDFAILLWFNRMYAFRKYWKIRAVALFLFDLILICVANEMGITSPVGRIAVASIYCFVTIWMLYENIEILQRALRTILLLLTMILAEFVAMAVILNAVESAVYETIMDSVVYWFVCLVLTRACELIFLNLINKIYFLEKKELSWRSALWHIFFLGSILTYLYLIVQSMYIDPAGRPVMKWTFWLNISFVILMLIGYYFFWQIYNEKTRQKMLIEKLLQKQEVQLEYYQKITDYEKEFRKIKHDLKNQLAIIGSLKTQETMDHYREEIDRAFSVYEARVCTGNEILDALLENKIRYCEEHDIEMEIQADFKRGGFLELLDVGTIFGNSIDNAIEACMRMKSGEKRICLFVFEKDDFIIIKLQNTFDGIRVKGGKLISMKEDRKNHGIGLYSLEQTLKKYNGSYRYDTKDGNFQLMILIPVKG